jgi:outer membrane receptor for ferric coprogen and ferric-rhodotorulic acid
LYASGPFELFGRRHELVAGYNGSRVYNHALSFEPGDLPDPGNFFQWDGSYPRPTFADVGDLVNDIHTRQDGIYTAARLSLAEHLQLIAGARYSIWKTDYFASGESPLDGFHYDFRKTIPYAGLIYDVSRNYSLFGSYTEIFKPQNSRDATGRYLDPIDGRSMEVGIKGEHFGGRLNTALTVFETKQNNVATPVLDPDSGEPVLLPDNTQASRAIDGTRTRGFELEVSGQLRPGWNASLGWSHYTFQDANDEPIRTFVPSTLVRTFTTWNAPGVFHRLTIGGGVNWQSTSHTSVGSPDGPASLSQPSVVLVSLMGRYQFTDNVSVQFNGNNLLDRKYYVLDEFDNTYYGAPVSWSVGVTVRL